MDCYVGAASGALKGIDFFKMKVSNVNVKNVKLLNPIVDEITAMCFVPSTIPEQSQILTCHADRHLRLFNATTQTSTDLIDVSIGKGILKNVQVLSNSKVIVGVESGEIGVWSCGDFINADSSSPTSASDQCNALNISSGLLTSWSCGNNLSTVHLNPSDENLLASGGAENPLKIWDLMTQKAIFTAKNVKQDSLELRVPIWETNMRFVGHGGNCIATTTKYHQIRLYDPRVQRRPITELEWLDAPLHALSTCFRENQLLIGNTRGELGLFDLRRKVQLVHKFRGFAGSIRAIHAHPTEPIFASCGIDRFVIVHNIDTKSILKKVFCKVALNTVLLCRESSLLRKSEPKTIRKKKSVKVKNVENNDEEEMDDENENEGEWD